MITRDRDDEDLLGAIRGGDLRAFDELYTRYERRLFGYLRRMVDDRELAEDLLQDVLLTVIRDRSFDPAKGRFAAWLFTVARNRCLEHHRRAAVRDPSRVPATGPTTAPDLEETVGRLHRVRAALSGLSEPERQLLLLKQVGDLTYRELADIHGVPEGTIKSRLHTATQAFRRRLAEIGEG